MDDTRYDLTISHFGVLAFATWRLGFDEMVRVTCPGGRIALVMWTHGDDCSLVHCRAQMVHGARRIIKLKQWIISVLLVRSSASVH